MQDEISSALNIQVNNCCNIDSLSLFVTYIHCFHLRTSLNFGVIFRYCPVDKQLHSIEKLKVLLLESDEVTHGYGGR